MHQIQEGGKREEEFDFPNRCSGRKGNYHAARSCKEFL